MARIVPTWGRQLGRILFICPPPPIQQTIMHSGICKKLMCAHVLQSHTVPGIFSFRSPRLVSRLIKNRDQRSDWLKRACRVHYPSRIGNLSRMIARFAHLSTLNNKEPTAYADHTFGVYDGQHDRPLQRYGSEMLVFTMRDKHTNRRTLPNALYPIFK